MKAKRVYLSGAIMYTTGDDLFARAQGLLKMMGIEPLNPKDIAGCPDQSCTRQPHELEMSMEHSWSCFIRYDLIAMLQCEAVLMLEGWENSHGARLEHQVAIATGIPVFYIAANGLQRLDNWSRRR